jgi:hypothetical protein
MTIQRIAVGLSSLLAAAIILLGATSLTAAEPAFDVFAASDAVRVFEDGYGAAQPIKEIRVFGLRNEVISAQCVVQARDDLKELSVSISPLKRREGSAVIPAADVQWNFVKGIRIEKNTRKTRPSDLIRPAPALFPDCLDNARRSWVSKGSLKSVYLTIRIPRDAEPGEYCGEVVAACGGMRVALPLVLTVYPLVLPDQRHVMVTEWFSTGWFAEFHGTDSKDPEQYFKMLRVYADNMAEHRQNVFRVGLELIRSAQAAGGKFRFDFSRFDRFAQVFWDTGRMDRLETGFVAQFGPEGWSGRQMVLNDFRVQDEATGRTRRMAGKEFLPQFLPALVKHLREKGWLEKTLFHIADEPSDHNIMAFREAADFVHRCAPELRRLDAIETTHCRGCLEVWIPKLDHLATWESEFEEARRQGNELWFYTVGIFQGGSLPNKTVDVPLVESRLLHWLNYRYGLTGYLHWGFNSWTGDPWGAPGQHNGDGWHVYPAKGGLLNSLRWEQMRAGLQDYECLWLLEDRIARIRATLSPRLRALIEPRRRGVEIASQVVRSYSDYTRDPAVLYAAKLQAIEATLDLDASPRVIVQTNPLEHSAVANDCSIEVHGWAEPGTSVRVNGHPVEPDGLFMTLASPSREGKIVVEAKSDKGRKTIVRKFRLMYEH